VRYGVYDLETHSTVNLKLVGAAIYSRHPTTDVLCVSHCIVKNGVAGPISTWLPGQPVPAEILELAADSDAPIVAFNDGFERSVETQILAPRHGWPSFPLHRRRCAQAIALTYALPGSLDKVAAALKLTTRKTAAGTRAMKQLAKPRKPRKGEDPTKTYWHDDPALFTTLCEYNRIDVAATAAIVERFGFIPPAEQRVWEMDAAINDRGLHIDVGLLEAAIAIGDQAAVELAEATARLTDGEITSPAQTARIVKWLAGRGCVVPDVQKDTLVEVLQQPDLSGDARQLIELRLNGAHAAVSKLSTLRDWVDEDQRIRGTFRYHGASPGRWTSVGVQMQNLKKPTVADTGAAIAAVRCGNLAELRARYPNPLSVVGDIARAMITAAPGHRLFIADLSGVESRGLAYIADEKTKLDAWREFDRTGDPKDEPYYRLAVEDLHFTGDDARARGKVADLAFQYGGVLGAWRNLAPADDATSDHVVRDYRRTWLRRHPNIQNFWAISIRKAVNAIEHPGERFTAARVAFVYEHQFLRLELPSGRRIAYPFVRLYEDDGDRRTFTFMDASAGRWEWYSALTQHGAFGGLIAENATQGLCRDLFVAAMLRLEAAGYPIVAHQHDEVVCEVPDDFGDLEEFRRLITTPPEWAPDFPLACKARIADRFIEMKSAPVETGAENRPVTLTVDQARTESTSASPTVEEIPEDAAPPPDDQPATATTEPQVCIQCHRELPDEPERANAHNGGWLHPECVDAFIRARMAEEGIPWDNPSQTAPDPNGGGVGGGANGGGAGRSGRDQRDSGRGDNGYDASCGDYGHEEHAGEPYDPIRIRLVGRGYRLARTFDFTLPGGTVLFSEDRYELAPHITASKDRPRKTSRYWHRVDSEKRSDTGPRRIIYNWPAIMAAGPGATVFVVEGANKADPLIAAGLLATAAPYHQWADECVEALAGRHLLYLEDHDHPDAKGHIKAKELSAAAQIKLAPRAASFRIVPALLLWKNLSRTGEPPHGWDVKDWIEQGGDAAKLPSVCKQVPAEGTEAIEPIDLWGQFDPPPLPTGLLPEAIEQFAREEGELMGADPSGLAMAALTVCAAALPDHTQLQVKRHDPHWLESTRLWVGLIGPPSTKKSPIMLRATKPLKQLDARLWRCFLAEQECYEQLSAEVRKQTERPRQTRLRLEDTTIEAAQEVLKDSPDGVLCIQDELAGWFGAMDKYAGRGAAKDRGFWLQSFHGGPYAVNRISRGHFMIENLSISLLGGIQPDPIRKVAADTIDDGLLQRLIPIVLCRGSAGKDAPTSRAAARYNKLVEWLRERERLPAPLQFNDAALVIREELEQRHLDLMAYEVINRKLAAHIGKYDGLFARLCLLWHCIEGTEGLVVTEHTARRVADFIRRFLLPHATGFYAGMLELSDNHDRLTKVAGHILAKKLPRITNRDVQRGNNAMRGLERQEIENIFDQLEALGWVFRTPGPYKSNPLHWLVNPEVHRRFAERAARETTERAREREMLQEMFAR
jgi:Protein of unknown function (DUF3987)